LTNLVFDLITEIINEHDVGFDLMRLDPFDVIIFVGKQLDEFWQQWCWAFNATTILDPVGNEVV